MGTRSYRQPEPLTSNSAKWVAAFLERNNLVPKTVKRARKFTLPEMYERLNHFHHDMRWTFRLMPGGRVAPEHTFNMDESPISFGGCVDRKVVGERARARFHGVGCGRLGG